MPHGGTIISFPGQEVNEQIFVYARRHPIAFLPTFLTITAMALLGIVLVFFLGLDNGIDLLTYNDQILIGSGYLLFVMLFGLVSFFDFYFDLNIVTDRRIVDIDQNRLFSRTVSELLMEDVQDVESKVNGVFATLFDFGDVMIQTAGAKPNFMFNDVAHPKEIAAIILDLSNQLERGIPPESRHPEGPVAAIYNGKLLPHTADHENELP